MAYTQCMWCWLFMSALRYMATKSPLRYTTLWRVPYVAMTATFVLAVAENSWLLLSVSASGNECFQESSVSWSLVISFEQRILQTSSKVHGIFDLVVSFVIPTAIVLYMDMNVLCCRMRPRNADPMLQIVINRPNGEKVSLP